MSGVDTDRRPYEHTRSRPGSSRPTGKQTWWLRQPRPPGWRPATRCAYSTPVAFLAAQDPNVAR
jgi:hypothetical protein